MYYLQIQNLRVAPNCWQQSRKLMYYLQVQNLRAAPGVLMLTPVNWTTGEGWSHPHSSLELSDRTLATLGVST